MYPIKIKEDEKIKLNKAKQKFLKDNLEKSSVTHCDVLNAALDFYLKE